MQFLLYRITSVIRRPGFWFILLLLVFITFLHYGETYPLAFFGNLSAELGLTRHATDRLIYLAIIIWSGFLFGWKSGIAVSIITLICMLPRAIMVSQTPTDALFETGAVLIVGNLVLVTFESLRREREHRVQLAALNEIVSAASQSLELNQVLSSSVENIMTIMKVDAVLLFLFDNETGELSLAAYRGVSEGFVESIDKLRLGEGFNGMVAQTGESMYVEDASADPRLTKIVVIEEGLRSEYIVPLKSKGRVMGTLCAANRRQCDFKKEEQRTLIAIGNQIGVVLENARLFEREREVARKLRISEERYRQLFENANDAIWINDMDGNIISANDAAIKLVGHRLEDLFYSRQRSLLSEKSLEKANEVRTKLLAGTPVEQPYELKLVMETGIEKNIRLMTNVFRVDSKPVGFQHIARDVTQQIRMQENLRFYLEHFTKAQEEERMRIAHELHDDTIQALVVLSRELDMLSLSKDGISKDKKLLLENLREQTNNIMAGVRRLSQDLRPPILDRLGLWAALEWLASGLENRSGISVNIKKHGEDRRLTSEAELLFFRIVQEALNNVWHHSKATHAEVVIELGENVTKVVIKDDGKGFDIPYPAEELTRRGKLGVAGMKERASLMGGTMEVDSAPGKGTTITVEAPV